MLWSSLPESSPANHQRGLSDYKKVYPSKHKHAQDYEGAGVKNHRYYCDNDRNRQVVDPEVSKVFPNSRHRLSIASPISKDGGRSVGPHDERNDGQSLGAGKHINTLLRNAVASI